MNKIPFSYILVALFSTLFGVVGGGVTSYVLLSQLNLESEGGETIIQFENGSYHEVYKKASPAVVSVVALKDLSDYYNQFSFFGFPQVSEELNPPSSEEGEPNLSEVSSGTGFIITPDGLVMTNKHVVEDESAEYVVVLSDGTELEAEVLDKDTLNDIALMQIVGEDERLGNLPFLEFADSDQLQIGDPVAAIGNALGEYSNTMTVGVVSATGRKVIASSGTMSESLVNLIQTDAAINPGNSGGPLLNLEGKVIGMNTAIYVTASNIGFAIPANDIATVLASYQEFGRIVRPFVGVRYIPVTPAIQKRFEIDVEAGVLVIGDQNAGTPGVVPDSPAEKAGLKEGDVILAVDDKELSENYTLSNAIAGYLVGETVTLKIWREGKILSIQLKLEENTQ